MDGPGKDNYGDIHSNWVNYFDNREKLSSLGADVIIIINIKWHFCSINKSLNGIK